MTTFFLRKSASTNAPTLTIYGRYYGNSLDTQINTGLKVEPSRWNKNTGRVKRGSTAFEIASSKDINGKLNQIAETIDVCATEYERHGRRFDREDIKKIVSNITNPKAATVSTAETIPTKSISAYIEYLIRAMEKGEFKVSGEDYHEQTIKMWKVFLNVFRDFEYYYVARYFKAIRWDDIDKSIYDTFINYSRNRGYMISTINNQIACFKAAIKYSGSYHHLHKNTGCTVHFHLLKRKENDSRARIYLTPEEVDALYNMELKPGSLYEQVRDVFCAGIYCGQRFSDYGRLSPEHFTTTERGTNVIHLTQKKTGRTITVPFLSDNLKAIVAKYDYDLPEINEVIVNKYIKTICRRLSASVPSLAEKVPTTLTLSETRMEEKYRSENDGKDLFERNEYGQVVKPRYELITTHTARRTTITNLFKSHAFTTYQLMAISGHKTTKNLLLYVRESGDEVADEIDSLLKEKGNLGTAGLF